MFPYPYGMPVSTYVKPPAPKPDSIPTIAYKDERYPAFQASGNASRFAIPFAKEVCKGRGVDVGYGKEEWKFPDAMGIDPAINPRWNARDFAPYHVNLDYIFSSHLLEHLDDWVAALNYWRSRLRPGGVVFLYLPHYSQEYWRPWNNYKHKHVLTPEIIRDYLNAGGWKNVFVGERDLNHSFACMAENGLFVLILMAPRRPIR